MHQNLRQDSQNERFNGGSSQISENGNPVRQETEDQRYIALTVNGNPVRQETQGQEQFYGQNDLDHQRNQNGPHPGQVIESDNAVPHDLGLRHPTQRQPLEHDPLPEDTRNSRHNQIFQNQGASHCQSLETVMDPDESCSI